MNHDTESVKRLLNVSMYRPKTRNFKLAAYNNQRSDNHRRLPGFMQAASLILNLGIIDIIPKKRHFLFYFQVDSSTIFKKEKSYYQTASELCAR